MNSTSLGNFSPAQICGDAGLLAGYRARKEGRHKAIAEDWMIQKLQRSRRMVKALSPDEARTTIWVLSGMDLYNRLVLERGRSPSRYEKWLADVLIQTLLEPRSTGI